MNVEWSPRKLFGGRRAVSSSKPALIRGCLDKFDEREISGWVMNTSKPDVSLGLEVFADGRPIARAVANAFRPDVLAAGIGTGNYGFVISVPSVLFDGKRHWVEVRESLSGFVIPGSRVIFQMRRVDREGIQRQEAAINRVTPRSITAARLLAAWRALLHRTVLNMRSSKVHRPTSNASATLPQKVSFEGYFEACCVNEISGWIIDPSSPLRSLQVEVFANGKHVVRAQADVFRPDLLEAGVGTGKHGFQIMPPNELFDGRTYSIEVREVGTGFLLSGSPKVFCARSDVNRRVSVETGHLFARSCGELTQGVDAEYYLQKYPDIKLANIDPVKHYHGWGRQEGRSPRFDSDSYLRNGDREYTPGMPTVLVVCHEASRTGAPILGLRLAEEFARWANVVSWIGKKGPLTNEFGKSSVAVIDGFPDPVDSLWLIKEIIRRYSPEFAVINSAVCVPAATATYEVGLPFVALVHEYADYVKNQVLHMLYCANRVIFPANSVKSSADLAAQNNFGKTTNTVVRHQGRCLPPYSDGRVYTEAEILSRLGVLEGENKPAIVLGCGWVQMRKGVEYFIDTARLVNSQLGRPLRFVWVGNGYFPDTDLHYSTWLRSQVVNSNLEDIVFFFEETVDLSPFWKLADVFFLSSRLDPFPNVAIDAVDAGVPVVVFERGSGFAEFIEANPAVGAVVPYLDTASAGKVICEYIEGMRSSCNVREAIKEFSFPEYAKFVWDEGQLAISHQRAIEQESQRVISSGVMDVSFFRSSGSAFNPSMLPEYVYVANWARGIKLVKSAVGFNDKVAERNLMSVSTGALEAISPLGKALEINAPIRTHDVIRIDYGKLSAPWSGGMAVAVHIHAYYIESLGQLLERFGPYQGELWFSVTTNTDEKAKYVEEVLSTLALKGEVLVIPNRGRDVGPFLMMLQERLSRFDLVGHFHLKGTKQLSEIVVRQWQDFLYDSLIGSRGEVLNELLHALDRDPMLGFLFQEDPNLLSWNKNYQLAKEVAAKIKLNNSLPDDIEYPTGNMFWARREALAPLLRYTWSWEDFPGEPVAYDGTILHAIERLMPIVCAEAGYRWATVFNPTARRSLLWQ